MADMRTTLDLDPRLLAAAKARANHRGITLGAAVSELGLRGLASEQPAAREEVHGLVMLPATGDRHLITDRMVADALAED